MTDVDPRPVDGVDDDGAAPLGSDGDAPGPPAASNGVRDPGPDASPAWWRHPRAVGAAALVVLAMPLAVALGALHSPRWYPILDLAQSEMRVRDVGTSHPTLVGAAGRIEAYGVRGSHPGPLAYWMLRPVYTLLGGTAFGLQVATVGLHLAGMAVALWIAARRGGVGLVLALAALLAVLCHLYGAAWLTEAWNPYFPLLWWPVFLLAAWSVLCDDLAMLPVAAFAGSLCAQAHNSYLGLVGGVAAALAVAVVLSVWRRRNDRAARRRAAWWTAAALAVSVVVWLPPLVEQLTRDPGNLSIVLRHLRDPAEAPIGTGRALELLGVHLDPWRLLGGRPATAGTVAPGLVLVGLWLVSAVVAVRVRADAALVRLHVLLAVVLTLSAVSVSRIFGEVWFYLALWAWGTTILMLLAVGWTLLAVLSRGRWADGRRTAHRQVGAGLSIAVLVLWSALFTADAARTEVPAADQSRIVSAVAPRTIAALEAPGAPGGGRDGRYLVTWTDPVALGGPAQGLLLELERHGFDARALPAHEVALRAHRVTEPADATAEIHVAVGSDIDGWRQDRPDARELVHVDLRSDADRARYDRVRADLADALAAAGMDATDIDDRISGIAFDPASTPEVKRLVNRLAVLGQPVAVFVTETPTGA